MILVLTFTNYGPRFFRGEESVLVRSFREPTDKLLLMYFLRVLYTWSQALEDRVNLTFVDFVDNLCKGIEGIRFFGFALVYVAAPPWCPFMV